MGVILLASSGSGTLDEATIKECYSPPYILVPKKLTLQALNYITHSYTYTHFQIHFRHHVCQAHRHLQPRFVSTFQWPCQSAGPANRSSCAARGPNPKKLVMILEELGVPYNLVWATQSLNIRDNEHLANALFHRRLTLPTPRTPLSSRSTPMAACPPLSTPTPT